RQIAFVVQQHRETLASITDHVMVRSQEREPHLQDAAQQRLGFREPPFALQQQTVVALEYRGIKMSVTVGTLPTAKRIEIKRFRLLELPHVLRDDCQVLQALGYARMIIAEYAAIDIQSSFISLFRQQPLLLACI